MEGKIPVFLGVPVETREFSWGHDRCHDARSCAARMRKRGTKKIKQPTPKVSVEAGQIAADDLNCQQTWKRAEWGDSEKEDGG